MTIPHGINQSGDVVGEFEDINGAHAFIRLNNGKFSPPLTDPNDSVGETFGFDLNESAFVGFYIDLTTFASHSFLFTEQAFTDLDIVGAASTQVSGLNSAGDFCGAVDPGSGVTEAFVNIASQLTEFAIPGASYTAANAINDFDTATGPYQLGDTNNHGFVRYAAGNLTYPIDYPGATSTNPRGINNNGLIVGSYIDTQSVQRAFVFRPPDRFVSCTYPGSTYTTFEDINDWGQICGQYKDADGQRHAFIARINH
jgi:hypothetical protein